MLEVTAEAFTDLSILRATKRFYLRDIGMLSKTELRQRHSTEDYQDSTVNGTFLQEKKSQSQTVNHSVIRKLVLTESNLLIQLVFASNDELFSKKNITMKSNVSFYTFARYLKVSVK